MISLHILSKNIQTHDPLVYKACVTTSIRRPFMDQLEFISISNSLVISEENLLYIALACIRYGDFMSTILHVHTNNSHPIFIDDDYRLKQFVLV